MKVLAKSEKYIINAEVEEELNIKGLTSTTVDPKYGKDLRLKVYKEIQKPPDSIYC
jgi:hypothetical protein